MWSPRRVKLSTIPFAENLRNAGWIRLFPLLVIAAGILAYHNSFFGPFIFDDTCSIVNNANIRRLWPLWTAMSTSSQTSTSGRPLVSLSLAINYAFGGLNVWGYHFLNLLVHVLAGLVLFAVVRHTLDGNRFSDRERSAAPWLAFIVSLIWTVHPLQTESVTYIIQRSESLVGLFYLLTVYCAIRGFEAVHSNRWYGCAVIACGVGMASKEVMATAPLIVLLYDWFFKARSFKELLQHRWGFYVALASTWLILGALVATGPRTESVGFGFEDVSPLTYALTQCEIIPHYLRLVFWPDPLVLDYAWPVQTSVLSVLPGLLFLGVLIVFSLWGFCIRSPIGFLGAWLFLILSPSSSVVPIVTEVAAEHRMYLPMASVICLVVVGIYRGMWCTRSQHVLLVSVGQYTCMLLVLAGIGTLGLLTVARNEVYQSEVRIWKDVVTKVPNNPRGHNNLADALRQVGQFESATFHYREAVRIQPDEVKTYNNMAINFTELGKFEEALRAYRRALEIEPNFPKAHYNLGMLLYEKGRSEQALIHFKEVLRSEPLHFGATHHVALILASRGDYELATGYYQEALEIQPDDPEVHNNLGVALAGQGKFEEAIGHYQEALRIRPNHGKTQANWGVTLSQQGKFSEAVPHYLQSLQEDPKNAETHFNLGLTLAILGNLGEAKKHFEVVIQIQPEHFRAEHQLGKIRQAQGENGSDD